MIFSKLMLIAVGAGVVNALPILEGIREPMSCNAGGQACCQGSPNFCHAEDWVLCNNGSPELCATCGDTGITCCNADGHALGALWTNGYCRDVLCDSTNSCGGAPCGQKDQACCETYHPKGQCNGIADLICSDNKCVTCGGQDQPCCEGQTPCTAEGTHCARTSAGDLCKIPPPCSCSCNGYCQDFECLNDPKMNTDCGSAAGSGFYPQFTGDVGGCKWGQACFLRTGCPDGDCACTCEA